MVDITDNLCTKQGNSSKKIAVYNLFKSGFKSRAVVTTFSSDLMESFSSQFQDLNNASSTHSSLPPATMQVSRDSVEMDSANPTEDNHEVDDESSVSGANGGSDSGLAQFLIERASRNSVIANYFYWYLVSFAS